MGADQIKREALALAEGGEANEDTVRRLAYLVALLADIVGREEKE